MATGRDSVRTSNLEWNFYKSFWKEVDTDLGKKDEEGRRKGG